MCTHVASNFQWLAAQFSPRFVREEDAEADYTSFEKLPNGDLLVEGLTFQHFNKARYLTCRIAFTA